MNLKQFRFATMCFLAVIAFNDTLADCSPEGRTIKNLAFGVGEELRYDLRYGPLAAGDGIMEVKGIKLVDQHPCFHVVSTTHSNDFFSMFFKVRDQIESLIDVRGVFSRGFSKQIHEGSFKRTYSVSYDHERHQAFSEKDTTEIPPFVQDPLSSFYFLRVSELKPGKSVFIDSHSNERVHRLEVRVLKREWVKVKAGRFKCLVVEPVTDSPSLFFKSKGKLTIWFSDDQRKIPVQMKLKMRMGSLTAELARY